MLNYISCLIDSYCDRDGFFLLLRADQNKLYKRFKIGRLYYWVLPNISMVARVVVIYSGWWHPSDRVETCAFPLYKIYACFCHPENDWVIRDASAGQSPQQASILSSWGTADGDWRGQRCGASGADRWKGMTCNDTLQEEYIWIATSLKNLISMTSLSQWSQFRWTNCHPEVY